MRKAKFILVWLYLVLSVVITASGSGVPAGTSIDNQATAAYQPSGGTATSANSNIVHVITQSSGVGAAISVVKSASKSTANPGDQLTFALDATNSGTGDAAPVSVTIDGVPTFKIVVRDVIPSNTKFAGFAAFGASTPLYHIFGSAPQTYVSTAPSDLSTVDAIAFTLDSFAAGSKFSFSFNVAVAANASGTIRNLAVTFFNNGADTSVSSNEVDVAVKGAPPSIAYYFDGNFSLPIQATAITSPLWVQVNAAACNVDPTTVESHPVTLQSTLTGDTETFTATETGANTGIFRILPAVPMRDGSVNPVIPGNKIMEVLRNDQLTASLSGCGAATVTATILIDPAGVIFDSHSNSPIAGAGVTLIDVTGNGNGGHPKAPATVLQFDGITPAPSTVTTAANGQFQFPQVLPSTYKIVVTPPTNYTFPSTVPPAQLPAGRRIDPGASYNGSFVVSASAGATIFDVPLDTTAATSIFIQKTADRSSVEQGDFVNYTVEIKNMTSTVLTNTQVKDTLPPGFVYQLKSAHLGGASIPDPTGGKGPFLTFNIGTLTANADLTLTYRVFIGPGVGVGDALNKAVAQSGSSVSNVASARVTIQAGIFSDNGFIVGKVFEDCNGNRIQDPGELGIPGVRIYLEDGTFAITDEKGKYSLYGVSGRTHILKVDRYSLPSGVNLVAISSRNAGDGGSRFVDMKFGEMHKADFAVNGCSEPLANEIAARVKKQAGNDELGRGVKAQFNPQPVEKSTAEVKGLSASGFVGTSGAPQQPASSGPSAHSTPADPAAVPSSVKLDASADANAEYMKMDNFLGFIDLHDHMVLPFAQSRIRVKGQLGNTFKLYVNGVDLPAKQVGMKATLPSRELEVWEFVGVNLRPGKNELKLIQLDPWGNERGTHTIEVITPSQLGKLKIDIPKPTFPADGKTVVKVNVRLTDSNDVPVTVRTPITLETTNGVWRVRDLDPKEPGVQVFIEGGQAEYELMSPAEPGTSMIRVSSGGVSLEKKIEFVPELRPMMAAGIVEYQVNFGSLGHSAVQPSLNDGFEHELQLFSMQSADGSTSAGGRAALLLKGKILGENLLTLAYDSDKASGERLFRDIQPDQYYPVYGDASVRGYDAQSTSKAYIRIDHGRTYVLYGDFLTADPSSGNSLGNYSRSMTGVKEHFENERVKLTGFAAFDSLRQVVDEIPANGTSGPYVLSNPNGVENSEKVEVLTRDRNQPAVIIDSKLLTRFVDYEFEPFTGQLLLKAPLFTLDSNMNLISLRITYEVNTGGDKFWVGGGTAQVKLTEMLQIGGTFVDDSDPQDPNKLFAVNSVIKLQEKTSFLAEFAGTQHETEGSGAGYRFELNHDDSKLKMKAYFTRTDANFDNPTSIMNKGRGESGVKASYVLTGTTRLTGEFIRTEDVTTMGTQQGGKLALEKSLPDNVQMSFGFRHAQETATPANPTDTGVTPNTIDTIFTKISAQVPHFTRATASGEYEQDISNMEKRVMALGGNYQLWSKGKLYFRQELISSLGDVYSLNSLQRRNTTQFGIDTTYYKDAHVFSEYRVQDLSNGREAEAAVGLRNNWHLAQGLVANTGLESIRTLNGTDVSSLAVTGGIDYTAHPDWKGSARMEWRGSSTTNNILSTLGFASRISDSWSFLGRDVFATTTTKGATGGTHLQNRMQFGFALRDADRSRWNALSMFEIKTDDNNSVPGQPTRTTAGIFSTAANYQVMAPLTFSGRYAAKWSLSADGSPSSSATTQLVGARATWDLNRRWDLGVASSTTYSMGFSSRQYGMGFETGYKVIQNLWISTGYNLLGFRNPDLTGEDVTRRGAFIRMRFKFDENIFSPKGKNP